jgi:hypothetical protein
LDQLSDESRTLGQRLLALQDELDDERTLHEKTKSLINEER